MCGGINQGFTVITFERLCVVCKKKTNHLKALKFSRLSNIIILSLQRFDFARNIKNEIAVNIDEIIDLHDFIDKDFCNNNSVYHLNSILCHEGFIDFGHYFSIIKLNGQDKWFKFDDKNISEIDFNNIYLKKIYALIYRK